MSMWFKVFVVLSILYMTWQVGRWKGFEEGRQYEVEAIGRSTVPASYLNLKEN